jgi:hypothetical protein
MDRYFFDAYGVTDPIVDVDGMLLDHDRQARDIAMYLLCEYYSERLFDTDGGQIVTIKVRRDDGSIASELLLSIIHRTRAHPDERPADATATATVVPLRPARLDPEHEGGA